MRSLYEVWSGPESRYFATVAGGVGDDDARERYRAWLAEQGEERAELFAIEASLLRDDFTERAPAIARAKEILSKSSFVREWWRLVTRTSSIRNCGKGPAEPRPVRFAYECPRTWDSLSPTGNEGARHCSTCERLVYLCRSRDEAEERAHRGECITIPGATWSAVAGNLTSAYTGRPDPVAIWADRVFPGERTDE
jgi:hypothetical protein